MFEIYKTTEGRKKTYLVFNGHCNFSKAIACAKKFFKVSEDHIDSDGCWILNDELYFEDPHKKNAKKMIAFFWHK